VILHKADIGGVRNASARAIGRGGVTPNWFPTIGATIVTASMTAAGLCEAT